MQWLARIWSRPIPMKPTDGQGALVIADERHIARLVEVNLRRQGYRVEWAQDRDRAIRQFDPRTHQIVILSGENREETRRAIEEQFPDDLTRPQIIELR